MYFFAAISVLAVFSWVCVSACYGLAFDIVESTPATLGAVGVLFVFFS